MDPRLTKLPIILASKSPRRQYLLNELGVDFKVVETCVEEVYPDGLSPHEIALYLAGIKADSLDFNKLDPGTIVITADTIVCLDEEILGKPTNYADAVSMLRKLSGRKHDVITGVCVRSEKKKNAFSVLSSVYFKVLTINEIKYYIERFQPFDKAGGYGIQEWIGYIGIDRIDGSFFNVMGLPVRELYDVLSDFADQYSPL
jgi:septum formation protein